MPAVSKRQIASLLEERRRAMGGHRFKPENFSEIQRLLGPRYAPDLNRVTSKHRAEAASAYLRRLHRDMEKSQEGYYTKLQAMPLQIKSLNVKKEDPRSFKSVLIPKLKLSPLKDTTPSPRSLNSVSPTPPFLSGAASTYVPHKSFSPHSHTHIHVLFKQMPGSVTPRKGAGSVVSSEKSGGGASSMTDSKHKLPVGFRPSPRGSISKVAEDLDPVWPVETPAPFAHPKFVPSPAIIPHIKKRLPADKSPRAEKITPAPSPRKSEESSPVNQFVRDTVREAGLPPKVAAALAAESNTTALYKFDLPPHLAASYNKNLPGERPKAVVLAKQARLPLPAIPKKPIIDNELLAIVSVQHTNAAIHAAA